MQHQDITRVYREKGSDLAVGWSKLWPKQRQTRTRTPVENTACVSDWIWRLLSS